MQYIEDIDVLSDEDNDNYIELPYDIIKELEYDKKINIVNFYKQLLEKEPEFYGLNNINSGKFLNVLENTKIFKMDKNDYKINYEQYLIYNKLYNDLKLDGNYDLYNSITKNIYKLIYI